MTFITNWDEFERCAEHMYMENPSNTRYTMKYSHSKEVLVLKVTDNVKCLQYKTEIQQDLRKIDKFVSNLMRDMTAN